MRYAIYTALVLAVAVQLIGCGPPLNVPSTMPQPTAAPPADTARIFFFLPQGNFMPVTSAIFHDEEVVGFIRNRQYFYYDVPAGEHFFMSYGQPLDNVEGLAGEFLGGRTYYIKVIAAPGFQINRTYWAPLEPGTESWDKRIEWIDACEMMMLNPEVDVQQKAAHRRDPTVYLQRFKSGEMKSIEVSPQFSE